MCPCTKRQNVFSGTSGSPMGQSKFIHSRGRNDSSAGSPGKTFALKISISKQNVDLLDPAGNTLPVIAKARLVIQGQHCPENAQSFVEPMSDSATDSSQRIHSRKPREVEEPLYFELPSRGLPGVEKGALIEIVMGVLGCPISPRGWWKELRDTLPRRLVDIPQTGPCLLLAWLFWTSLFSQPTQPPSRISHLSPPQDI